MKAKIRKTGEIVKIISYSGRTDRCDILDRVSYIDSNGKEHPNEHLNFYWDFEVIPEHNKQVNEINWVEVRINAAIAAMQGLCNTCHENVIREIQNQKDTERSNVISFLAVKIADSLINELK